MLDKVRKDTNKLLLKLLTVFQISFDIHRSVGLCGISVVVVILKKRPKLKLNFFVSSKKIVFNG